MMKKRMMKRLSAVLAISIIIMSFGMSYASAAENTGFIRNIASSDFFLRAGKTISETNIVKVSLKSSDIDKLKRNRIVIVDASAKIENSRGFEISMPVLPFEEDIDKLIIKNQHANAVITKDIVSLAGKYTFFTMSVIRADELLKTPEFADTDKLYTIKFYAGDLDNPKAKEIKYLDSAVSIFFPYSAAANAGINTDNLSMFVYDYDGKDSLKSPYPIISTKYINGGISFGAVMNGLYALSYQNNEFTDISSDSYAYDKIKFLASKGIVNGTDKNIYSPLSSVTRADSMLILMRAMHIMPRDEVYDASAEQATEEFYDTRDNYYSQLIHQAKKAGIAQGFDNLFEPEKPITRQDLMCLVVRSIDCKYPGKLPFADVKILDKFTDLGKIDAYAKESTARLVKAGIINGYPDLTFAPLDYITREETAAIIARISCAYDYNNKIISKNASYNYSYPGPGIKTNKGFVTQGFKNDADSTRLTSNEDLDINKSWPEITLKDLRYDRGGQATNESIYLDMIPHFYLTADLGFICSVNKISMAFKVSDGYTLPSSLELYYGNDGTNNNFYLGDAQIQGYDGNMAYYILELCLPVDAKTIKIVANSAIDAKISFNSLQIYGEKSNYLRNLSLGCEYTTDAITDPVNADSGSKEMTDGKFAVNHNKTDSRFSVFIPTKKQNGGSIYGPYYENYAEFIIDLKEIKNVSDIKLSSLYNAKSAENISRMQTYISCDNEKFTEFGMSSKISSSGRDMNLYRGFYKVTHNSTQKARYVKIKLITDSKFVIDEITISGCSNEVEEPDYGFEENHDYEDYTNVAVGAKAFDINDNTQIDKICNGIVDNAVYNLKYDSNSKKTGIIIDLGKNFNEICQVMYQINNVSKNVIKEVNIYVAGEDKEFKHIGKTDEVFKYSDNTAFRLDFEKTPARYIKIEADHNYFSNINVREVEVYNGKPHVPIITGGFHAYFSDLGPNFTIHHYDDAYNNFLYLKGLKEMGMQMVVFGAAALQIEKEPSNELLIKRKLTIYDDLPQSLKDKGYVQGAGYPSKDIVENYLAAADKVNIDVMLSTMAVNPPLYAVTGTDDEKYDYLMNYIKKYIQDGKEAIEFMHKKYKHHKSLLGFYFVDETCDYWLNWFDGRATDLYREIYKQQAEKVRELDENLLTMACPAIWRSWTNEEFKNNIKRMIENTEGDKRPFVDIIAFQDCLGREESIVVNESVYPRYEALLEAGCEGVREAGALAWNDVEVFDARYFAKRYSEVKKCLDLEVKHTRKNILFDLPIYFTPPVAVINTDPMMFTKENNTRVYFKNVQLNYSDYIK